MGRGKIEIKRIENPTNRQVTYSKRRGGIIKKAKELTVLCDAEVSLIMFSSTGKFSEYCSPSTSTKKIYDRYQQVSETNLWDTHYEKMQRDLGNLKEESNRLRKLIRQKMGEDINELKYKELRDLEQNLEEWVKRIRDKKNHLVTNQTETCKKRTLFQIKNLEEQNKMMRHMMEEDEAERGLEDDGDYESQLALGVRNTHLFAYRMRPAEGNIHDRGYGLNDLRLG
ncbi:MADS-box transcription factor 16 isoform X1 [Amborella trichopoda]|uniref:MADS-box transcription factor 16 isoform X1 n=1 Tax=Amborella trichopoda TaxID=13333 RepID=UPI0009BFE793|nr:MADS-box transcription factor 16 isoform X1 [Amborella trichopoda]|eukprot:XP_020532212.1 MADS-box transcription factor 16 isoform X1 [Amborella trichopoda]